MIFIWIKYYGEGKNVQGYSLPYLVTYYSLVVIISLFISKVEVNVKEDIKDGGLVNFVIRPFNYLFYRLFWEVGWYVIKVGFFVGPFILLLYAISRSVNVPLELSSSGLDIMLGILSSLLAYVLSFILSMIIGSLAFFITEITGIANLYEISTEFLTGKVFPISFFPVFLQNMLVFTPFIYITAFPVEVFMGKLGINESLQGIGIQCLWILLGYFVYRLLWRMGIKKFSGVGL
jgi:ABC-2 type transport system permease protein